MDSLWECEKEGLRENKGGIVSRFFSFGASGKEPACQFRRPKRCGIDSWVGKIPLEEGMATHSSVLAWRIPRTGACRVAKGRTWLKQLSIAQTHSVQRLATVRSCYTPRAKGTRLEEVVYTEPSKNCSQGSTASQQEM